MPDQNFTSILIPEGYSARLQRGAVLHRLVGRCRSGQEIVAGTERVLGMWRARLHVLRSAGWQPKWTPSDWQFIRNCCPTFILVRPVTRRCNLSYVCPFCYARRLHTVWSRLSTVFGWPQQSCVDSEDETGGELLRSPRHLLVRTFTKDIELTNDSVDQSVTELLTTRIRKTLDIRSACVGVLKTRGAFTFTEFVPTQVGWRMEYRELHVVDATYVLPSAVSEITARLEEPTRAELARAIADFCAYPTELMFGPAEHLKVALDARVGLRLFNTYGILRQQRR